MSSFLAQIQAAYNVEECRRIRSELESLLHQVTTKLERFEEEAKTAGLNFRGQDAIKCICGHTMDAEGEYVGDCQDCQKSFCVDCLTECEECGNDICNYDGEGCAVLCAGCECDELCQECGTVCDHCEEKKMSDGCGTEIGYLDKKVCPECYDYISDPNR